MKARLLLLRLLSLVLLTCMLISPCHAIVVTFDDLPSQAQSPFIPKTYESLNWSNFVYLNAVLLTIGPQGSNGFYNGMVSASNVVGNAVGTPAEIDSLSMKFNFLSAYLTGARRSNLNIEVQGFSGTNLLYDTTVVASATTPTLFTFNYTNIDRLYFNAFGGQSAGFLGPVNPSIFAMDNFTFEFVPEPSTVLLTGVGVLVLWPLLKRKRA